MPTLYLFDVDGTLIHAGGAGRRAVRRAFGDLWGRPEVVDDMRFGGMTDPAIVGEGLARLGVNADASELDRFYACYLSALEEEVACAEGYRVMPGVEPALERLAGRDGCALGLGTGNLERGARVKLQRGGLNRYFGFGGYGSDHLDRAELLRVGAARGAAVLGGNGDGARIVVVGDTERDVWAAHAIGAVCVAVQNGFGDPDALRAAGPDYLLASLDAAGALEVLEAAGALEKNGISAGSAARPSANSAPS